MVLLIGFSRSVKNHLEATGFIEVFTFKGKKRKLMV